MMMVMKMAAMMVVMLAMIVLMVCECVGWS